MWVPLGQHKVPLGGSMSTLDPNLQILDFDGVIRFPGVEGFPDCLLNDLQRRVSELSVTDVSGTGPQARRGL